MVAFKVLLAFMVLSVATVVEAQVRGCYYQYNAAYRTSGFGQFNSNKNYRWGLCSHVFYAFAQITGNTISAPTVGFPVVQSFRDYNPSLKLILSIGGWNSEASFISLVNSGNIQGWANNAVAYAKNNKFVGIDIDWEFPNNAQQKAGLTNILKALRNAGGSGFVVTVAGWKNPSDLAVGFDLAAIKDIVDFINVMTYDYAGYWGDMKTHPAAPLNNGVNGGIPATIDYYLKYVPASKIILGVPTYGVGWKLASSNGGQGYGASTAGQSTMGSITQQNGYMAQYELCRLKGTLTYDNPSQTRYRQDGNQFYTYEIVQSVVAKMNYVKQKKLGGAFIWSMDQDDINNTCGNSYPYVIMNTINKELVGKTFT